MSSVSVQLQRNDFNEPWGFRMQGGKDFRLPLSVKRVIGNSPAARGRVDAGDAILSIAGRDTSNMSHLQAQQLIKNAGTTVSLTLQKGACQSLAKAMKPTGPVKFSVSRAQNYMASSAYQAPSSQPHQQQQQYQYQYQQQQQYQQPQYQQQQYQQYQQYPQYQQQQQDYYTSY